ncbi:DoxX family protein [Roseinatronobacter alkalisoli]|uniref:DoxX family protein n=1 Tax=Roseinatronobacter alkalisoli TaxID=3028235 RepID=A0ABT5T6S9_9RHOB|nr:DoxX family protein [Roseinatronobacter sp. HJB301]MDD7970813.1 DoxX family protein [Roseinatronobacter sp. HJB301]
MNILLWTLQALLAAHTAIGAGWKFFNSEQTVPSLSALPHSVWLLLIPIELICALGLLAPAIAPAIGYVVPLAATVIVGEMLMFAGLHLRSGTEGYGPVYYWLGVVVICAIIAAGRWFLAPL